MHSPRSFGSPAIAGVQRRGAERQSQACSLRASAFLVFAFRSEPQPFTGAQGFPGAAISGRELSKTHSDLMEVGRHFAALIGHLILPTI